MLSVFPSQHDANNLWQAAKEAARVTNPLALLSFPLVIVIYVAHFLSVFWFDYLYGIALGLVLPQLLLERIV